MKTYDVFYVDGCEKQAQFQSLLRILLAYADNFSLIYFKYHENDKTPETTKIMKKRLSKFAVDSRLVTYWPLTWTRNYQNHIYRMVTYRIGQSVEDILTVFESLDSLWNLDYPQYPMDLCFYRNGRVLFASCTHEEINELYLCQEDPLSKKDILQIGLELYYRRAMSEKELFLLPSQEDRLMSTGD